ncbi:MAG: glycosyltransferase family 9 protein [Fimbriiglobus sp.]|jgi:heptosyltransferase-2|nr:glycosyltransferase family 9 protein [Fimbriiglobus sp.]
MKRVAVFLPNWIGDVVMATPAVRGLHRHFPERELLAVAKPYVSDTLAGNPWFTRTVAFDARGKREHRLWGVAKQLRALNADTAVLFPNSLRAAVVARLGGCRTVVGFGRYFRDTLLTKRLYPARDITGKPKPTPVIDDYNRIVGLLGVANPGHQMELFTTRADDVAAEAAWGRLKLHSYPQVIGLNPGGAFGSSKHWPTEHFAALARALAERGAGVVVLCGPSEQATAREIVTKAASPAVVSLADEPLSIGLTKATVRRLGLLVTTDSGPRHFAAAFGVPVVTLFGPTHIAWTETYFDQAIHVQKPVPCGPCQLRVCPLDHRCMTTLTPQDVLAAMARLGHPRQERRHAG